MAKKERMERMDKPERASRRQKKEDRLQLNSRMRNLLMFLPNLVKLCGRLLSDKRVPATDKALFAAAIIYVIMPLDFIPDVFPFIGQIDDIYLVSLTLLRLINRSDAGIVRHHWSGGGDIVALADSIAKLAPAILPRRVTRVLDAEVKFTGAGKALDALAGKNEAILVEVTPEQPVIKPTEKTQ
ncbi:MAG TPA: YkvA family protein [Pyrinomonadaceae bacterium]|nr:YkvA family protein [Pyrinomonadaceae bacterium]